MKIKFALFIKWIATYWWVILSFAFLIFIEVKGCKREVAEQRATQIINKFEAQPLDSSIIKYWKDRNEESHAIIESMTALNIAQSHLTDSINALLNTSTKQLKSIEQIRVQGGLNSTVVTEYETRTIPCPADSISVIDRIGFTYNKPIDPWVKIKGSVGVDHTNDSITYSSIDTISAIAYWKRTKVLGLSIGRKNGYVDFSSANPHNTITGGKRLDLVPPKHRYSVGFFIGAGYSPFNQRIVLKKPQFTFGLGINKNLISF